MLGVLVVSLVSTLRSRTAVAEFVTGVRELGVPPRLAAVTATGAVCTELLVVALLVLPGTAVAGLALAGGLFAVYTVGLALAVRRGVDTSCHCFGAGGDAVAPRHVARAAALSAWSLAGASWRSPAMSTRSGSPTRRRPSWRSSSPAAASPPRLGRRDRVALRPAHALGAAQPHPDLNVHAVLHR